MIFCARRTHAVESLLCSDAMPRRERRRRIVEWPHDDRCDDCDTTASPRTLDSGRARSATACKCLSAFMRLTVAFLQRTHIPSCFREVLCDSSGGRHSVHRPRSEGKPRAHTERASWVCATAHCAEPRQADSSAAPTWSSAPRGAIAKHA